MKKSAFLISTIVLIVFQSSIAQLPTTQIYSLSLRANEAKVIVDDLTLLTGFNPDGYNNQPAFIDDNHILITSDYKSQGLTDILELDTRLQRITRITHTEESEYSPTVTSSGFDFSVVRQELDDSTPVPQVLWSYPLDRSNAGQQLIADMESIGYYAWITKDKVAMFIVDETPYLILHDIKHNNTTRIATDVGRCIKTDKNGQVFYIQNADGGNDIRSYDIYLGRSRRVAPMIEGQQDFDLLANGHLIAGDGSSLKTYIPNISTNWKEIKDLSSAGIKKISRISSSRNKIAIVTAD